MSRVGLERKLRKECGMTFAPAHLALNTILETIEDEVAVKGWYGIPRFGRFAATTIKTPHWRLDDPRDSWCRPRQIRGVRGHLLIFRKDREQ
ncbi:hypothetical protein AA700_1058 [Acidiphilium acidophilum DSM 700]|nr:hypothetical protein AA700_1058 [Acidiphilium acidophilum DSM 700]